MIYIQYTRACILVNLISGVSDAARGVVILCVCTVWKLVLVFDDWIVIDVN